MVMNYAEALRLQSVVAKNNPEELKKHDIDADKLKEIMSVMRLANRIDPKNMDKSIKERSLDVKDAYSAEELQNMSLEELAVLETKISARIAGDVEGTNAKANEKLLNDIKSAAKKVLGASVAANTLDGKDIAPAEYLIMTGYIEGEKELKFVAAQSEKYDMENLLDKTPEEIESRMSTLNEMIYGDLSTEDFVKKVSKINKAETKELTEVVNSITFVDDNGENISDEEKAKTVDVIYESARGDAYVAAYKDEAFFAAKEKSEKEAIMADHFISAVYAKLRAAAVASGMEFSYEDKEEKEVKAEAKEEHKKALESLKESLKGAKVKASQVMNAVADTTTTVESFAKRAYSKVAKGKTAKVLLDKTQEVWDKAKDLWGERAQVVRAVSTAVKDNRWRVVANLAASVGVVAGTTMLAGTWPVAAVIAGYSAYSAAGNYVFPIIAKANKIRREAKENKQDVPSFKNAWKSAREELKNDEKYLRRAKYGAISAGIAAGLIGGASLFLPGSELVAQTAVKRGIARAGVVAGSLSTQIANLRAAKKAVNKLKKENSDDVKAMEAAKKELSSCRKQFWLGLVVSAGTMIGLSKSVASAETLNENVISDNGAVNDGGYELHQPEDSQATAVVEGENNEINQPEEQDAQASSAVVEGENHEAAAEEFVPAHPNAHSDHRLDQSTIMLLRGEGDEKEKYAALLARVKEMGLQDKYESLNGYSDSQLAYLMVRRMCDMKNSQATEAWRFLSGGDCGDMTEEKIAKIAEYATKNYNIDQDKTIGEWIGEGEYRGICSQRLFNNIECESTTSNYSPCAEDVAEEVKAEPAVQAAPVPEAEPKDEPIVVAEIECSGTDEDCIDEDMIDAQSESGATSVAEEENVEEEQPVPVEEKEEKRAIKSTLGARDHGNTARTPSQLLADKNHSGLGKHPGVFVKQRTR